MLPGLGGSELIIIAIVALVVVGPKDLPKLLRNLGKFIGKMRNMADDFKSSFDDMARQSELDDLRKEVEALRSNNLTSSIQSEMKAIESDISVSLNKGDSPVTMTPPSEPVDPKISYPQMDGLPPKWDAAQSDDLEAEVAPVKKPRARKPKVVAQAAAEPEVEPTVMPVKRSRRKVAS
ncbi:twin arginine-targeting protein translocase TatB [Asticcacaulis biprosthecium C19]|uniref:Sec-independent protein translocase protein TatB n=1 Tax=Asticcacaulis biprosthecium C19 TaxID=715226 RepID=F4QQ21_9CAUL|nr:Sec-independent protein translocase protein TatB [Asticcacaulis biprosthecium]EGF90308.1 twin arginine-targeting protein translocase TatB [Asticcacaulis biprosthecium C19]